MIRNAKSFARVAASGITQPAWLHPSMPTCARWISVRVFKYSKAAMTSPARSSNDALFQSPVEPPTPRLSYPKTGHPVPDKETGKGKQMLTMEAPLAPGLLCALHR